MVKYYVERDAGNKIINALSTTAGKAAGLTEILNESNPELQEFFNPPILSDTDDVFLDQVYTSPAIRAIVKKLSDIEGKSEFQVRNELKVLAKQIT